MPNRGMVTTEAERRGMVAPGRAACQKSMTRPESGDERPALRMIGPIKNCADPPGQTQAGSLPQEEVARQNPGG